MVFYTPLVLKLFFHSSLSPRIRQYALILKCIKHLGCNRNHMNLLLILSIHTAINDLFKLLNTFQPNYSKVYILLDLSINMKKMYVKMKLKV